ncbi:iron-containing alcohol dehydrogenase [Nonomuraea roseoviolacea subsp. roseoviolacea]|uniref:iron-containing alcohol dehydrogenase n=1 Tax=Nonomuraea roseoviolacea TaxID=103837 RepID=UPI0031D5D6CF
MSISRLSNDALIAGPPHVLMGPGGVTDLAGAVRSAVSGTARPPRVLLVVGGGFARRPWRERVLAALRPAAVRVAVQPGMPTPECVARLAGEARAHRADVVVAVGGGSVMDAAKAAAALSAAPLSAAPPAAGPLSARPLSAGAALTSEQVVQACADGVSGAGLPVVAVPTTPGTGAEATPFATIWDVERRRKLSLRGEAVRPAVAVLDPALLAGLPGDQLAASLLDTLAQGVEAAWSTRADERSEALGAAAWAELATLLDRPRPLGPVERRAVLLAGHYAGRAIAIAGTTICHALSYPLTLRHGVRHGHACGLTLAPVLRHNAAVTEADCADPRGPERVRAAVAGVVRAAGAADPDDLALRVEAFLAASDLPPVAGIRDDADRIAAEALGYDRAASNPRHVDAPALARLLTTLPCSDRLRGGGHAR